ncbi:sigma-70 family RNA polymerase sigma factor [Streptomyces sp. N2-109]|uniref:Sigma-70 family RNA polymerase sigma factor n=1 Tax=Streptomyces gossypii TaxID=2883101 RepID=A0ABT2K2E9_9ACTN|nr:sigma-70 family RNA polymerase sigma factor [Streptomyces gossypii]MCT2594337.1 sigma-70 family RNA polymerase sigma factor [Streptomyces gossypii]
MRIPLDDSRPTGEDACGDDTRQASGVSRQADAVTPRLWRKRRVVPSAERTEPSLETELGVREAYREYGGELLGYAYNALNDRHLAEEVIQETFTRAWRAAPSFDRRRSSVRTWLFAIARNAVVDAHRRRAVRPPVAGAQQFEENDRDTPPDPFDQLLTRIELDEALARLTPEHRQVIVEVYVLRRSCAEVAAEIGIPASTARSRLFHGVRALRGILEENGWLAP